MLEQAAAGAFRAVDIVRGNATSDLPPVGGRLLAAVQGEEAARLSTDQLPRPHAGQAPVDVGR